ncbi:uncharacterized protein LOC62_01G000773 [Vanrija pseudolonga]|uniref:BZIP domain-containing protein n=1 Tax=Vanrija pseudolonga TaxID=143232 RepID=A0AAF1BEW9_9TREE|nr:hypothetical protein LOC62_01G000773 [Vanrija pseudolonga]
MDGSRDNVRSACSPTGSLDVTLSGGSPSDNLLSNRTPADSAFGDNVLDDRLLPPVHSIPSPTVDPRTLFGGHPTSPGYYSLAAPVYGGQLQFWEPTPADVEQHLNIHSPAPYQPPAPTCNEVAFHIGPLPVTHRGSEAGRMDLDEEVDELSSDNMLVVKVEPLDTYSSPGSPQQSLSVSPASDSEDEYMPATPTARTSSRKRAKAPPAPAAPKTARHRSGERRQSQNRSAQSKYRAKNKTLNGLGWDFQAEVLAVVRAVTRKEVRPENAFLKLSKKAKAFQSAVGRTCPMTATKLAEDVAAKREAA